MVTSTKARLRHYAAVCHAVIWMYRNNCLCAFRQLIADHLDAAQRFESSLQSYHTASDVDVMEKKRSDRIFVFGSGYSLNDIGDETWQRFSEDDSLGFSGSIYMAKIPLTFLLLRAWTETSAGSQAWKNDASEVINAIEANPYLDDTIFWLPQGFTSIFTNRLLGYRMWNPRHRVFHYLPDKVSRLPHNNLSDGLVHGIGTLCSAISLAVAMGYREIVLVGVDLYDNRYFWLPPEKTLGWSEEAKKLVASDTTIHGASANMEHNTATNGIVDFVGEWARHLHVTTGQSLSVFNPQSLMTRTLPIFEWPGTHA